MISRTEICKQHAVECDRQAILATTAKDREHYRELAVQWRGMVEDAETLDRLSHEAKI